MEKISSTIIEFISGSFTTLLSDCIDNIKHILSEFKHEVALQNQMQPCSGKIKLIHVNFNFNFFGAGLFKDHLKELWEVIFPSDVVFYIFFLSLFVGPIITVYLFRRIKLNT